MESGLAARNGGRIGLAALVAILLLGLGLRVGEAWDGRAPVYDAAAYAAIAANLEGGEGFTVGRRRHAAVEQLLARAAAVRRRDLRAVRRRPRTTRACGRWP